MSVKCWHFVGGENCATLGQLSRHNVGCVSHISHEMTGQTPSEPVLTNVETDFLYFISGEISTNKIEMAQTLAKYF